MTKFVKIILEDKRIEPIYMPIEKWAAILEDPSILVRYTLVNETEWNGRSFNKTKVVASEPDDEYSKKANAQIYDLYFKKSENIVVRIPKGSLPPPGQEGDYQPINHKVRKP